MPLFYSASTNGFYDSAIHGSDVPQDSVSITEAEHAAIMQGQTEGKRIVPDSYGRPSLADPIPPDPSIALIATARAALETSDVTILRCVENAIEVPASWSSYRSILRSIINTGTGEVPTRPAYPPGT